MSITTRTVAFAPFVDQTRRWMVDVTAVSWRHHTQIDCVCTKRGTYHCWAPAHPSSLPFDSAPFDSAPPATSSSASLSCFPSDIAWARSNWPVRWRRISPSCFKAFPNTWKALAISKTWVTMRCDAISNLREVSRGEVQTNVRGRRGNAAKWEGLHVAIGGLLRPRCSSSDAHLVPVNREELRMLDHVHRRGSLSARRRIRKSTVFEHGQFAHDIAEFQLRCAAAPQTVA